MCLYHRIIDILSLKHKLPLIIIIIRAYTDFERSDTHTHTPEVYLYIRGVEVRIVSLVVGWWNDELWLEKTMLVIKPNWKWMSHTFYGWVSFPNVFLHVCVAEVWKVNARVIFSTSALHSFCMFFSFDDRSVLVLSIHTIDNNEVHSSATYTHTHTLVSSVLNLVRKISLWKMCLFAFGFFLLMRIWLPGNKMTFFVP